MTLEITNEAQAEAARELIAAVDKCLTHWPTSSLLTEDAQAALRAYEAKKAVKDIVLSEDELTLLKYAKLSHHETIVAMRSLRSKDLIYGGGDGNEYAISATDAGRVYLAQKPKLRWEVHNTIDTMQSLRGGFISEEEALKYKSFMSLRHPGGHYEVREVR